MTLRDQTSLSTDWIEPNPWKPGAADVRIKGFGNSVWALVGDLGAVGGDPARLAWEHDLPIEAVHAALRYYEANRAVIDARIAANSPNRQS